MHGGVVNENAALLDHFLNMSQAQWVRHIPANAGQHDFQRVVKPLEDLVQGAVDQTIAEIKHGRDCRLRLLRQSRLFYCLFFSICYPQKMREAYNLRTVKTVFLRPDECYSLCKNFSPGLSIIN